MKKTLILLLFLCAVCGCVIVGDSIVNARGNAVKIVAHLQTGETIERNLQPNQHVGERRLKFSDQGARYRTLEAYDSSGKEFGKFGVNQVPNARGRYGNFLMVIITENGIFPVPVRYLDKPEDHIAEIVSFYNEELEWEKSHNTGRTP